MKPHGTVVTLPHSSLLMKLPMRPKNRPSAGSGEVKSKTSAGLRLRRQAKSVSASSHPEQPAVEGHAALPDLQRIHASWAQNFSP